jgi:hypothetical protein
MQVKPRVSTRRTSNEKNRSHFDATQSLRLTRMRKVQIQFRQWHEKIDFMNAHPWQPIATAPDNAEIYLAVIEGKDVHQLAFRCRKRDKQWFNADTGWPVDVRPTHWRMCSEP